MKLWKTIKIIMSNKSLRDFIWSVGECIIDGRITEKERKRLANEFTEVLKSYF